MSGLPLGSTIYALLFVRKAYLAGTLDKLPIKAIEDAFVYSAVAYEHGGPFVLTDGMWEALSLELLTRKDKCSVDFHMAVNWDVLRMKATNLALDHTSTMWKDAENCVGLLKSLV